MPSLGVAMTLFLVITGAQSAANIIPLQFGDKSSFQPSLKMSRYMEAEGEVSRMFVKTFKSALIRVIKFYRTMKPEIILATCFSRYAGIVQGRSYQSGLGEYEGRKAARVQAVEEDEEDVTVQQFLRDMVHAMMLFMSDLTPQPVSTMMRTVMEMWKTTRDMYKAVKQDEMGNCSLEYMSKRFWWWLGI